jgi:hypothetical protein
MPSLFISHSDILQCPPALQELEDWFCMPNSKFSRMQVIANSLGSKELLNRKLCLVFYACMYESSHVFAWYIISMQGFEDFSLNHK